MLCTVKLPWSLRPSDSGVTAGVRVPRQTQWETCKRVDPVPPGTFQVPLELSPHGQAHLSKAGLIGASSALSDAAEAGAHCLVSPSTAEILFY